MGYRSFEGPGSNSAELINVLSRALGSVDHGRCEPIPKMASDDSNGNDVY